MKQILLLILAFAPFFGIAQQTKAQLRKKRAAERAERVNQLIKEEEDGALIYQKQGLFAFKFNTDGFGFLYEHGKYKTITKTNIWWLELSEKKQRNQQKLQASPSASGGGNTTVYSVGNSFVLGKQNNFYQLKLGFGQQRLLGNKGNKNGVAVSAIYGGGVSLGMEKPYYVQVIDPTSTADNPIIDIKYTDKPNVFLSASDIYGSSGFSKGLSEINFVPGLQTRLALRFDYGRYRDALSAIELGLGADFYSKKIQIMAISPAQNFFFNAYVALEFGKRH